MKSYLLEEVYELIDGIDRKSSKIVREELGDIFLILIVITEMFREKSRFNLAEVLEEINKKLVSRHPHVFSSKKVKNKEEVLDSWIKNKAKAKKRKSVKDRLPNCAPALTLANILFKEHRYLNGKQQAGIECDKLFIKISKELGFLRKNKISSQVLSGLIFDICNIAFYKNIDLESCLRKRVFSQARKTQYNKCKK